MSYSAATYTGKDAFDRAINPATPVEELLRLGDPGLSSTHVYYATLGNLSYPVCRLVDQCERHVALFWPMDHLTSTVSSRAIRDPIFRSYAQMYFAAAQLCDTATECAMLNVFGKNA